MQRCIAFIFTNMTYGSGLSQEGLNASLATCVFFDRIGIFFISDGVYLLLSDQSSNNDFGKTFMSSFEILSLCDVRDLYLCADSACERGLTKDMSWISDVVWLSSEHWRQRLLFYDIVLRF